MKDKVIVITGASAGIGAAGAEECARQGAKVVLAARREAELAKVAGRCGADAMVVPCDATKREQVNALCEAALKRHGRIDVWINNAGRGITRMPSQLTDQDLDEMMSLNVKSALYGIQAVLPHFQQRNAGQIINVSSNLGRLPIAFFRSAYSGAKAYLNLLSSTLRMELRQSHPGIQVTVVSPGVVATDFGKNALHGGVDSRALPNAQPVEEVAKVIAAAIHQPKAEVYTTPEGRQQVAAYYGAEDTGAFEAQAMTRR